MSSSSANNLPLKIFELHNLVPTFFANFSVTTEKIKVRRTFLLRDTSILKKGVAACVWGHMQITMSMLLQASKRCLRLRHPGLASTSFMTMTDTQQLWHSETTSRLMSTFNKNLHAREWFSKRPGTTKQFEAKHYFYSWNKCCTQVWKWKKKSKRKNS